MKQNMLGTFPMKSKEQGASTPLVAGLTLDLLVGQRIQIKGYKYG